MSSTTAPKFLGLSGKSLEWTVTVILVFGFVLVGYDQGVMSGVITQPLWLNEFPQLQNGSNATLIGFVVAFYALGCAMGALLIIFVGDTLGRKKACFLGGSLVLIGVTIMTTVFNADHSDNKGALAQFLIGRVIAGMGNGVNMASMPVWLAELSHAGRGMLVCLCCGLIATGTMLSYWLNYGVRNYTTSVTWRFPIAFQNALCLVYVIGSIFLPESPRWLCKADRVEEAYVSMAAINDEPLDGDRTKADIRGILESIAIEQVHGKKFKIKDMWTGGPTQHRRRIIIGVSCQFFQQIGGCNAVIYYSPILFKGLNLSENMSLLLGGVDMIVYATFALLSFITVDRVGRRWVFLIGTTGQCISMVITFACIIVGTPAALKGAAFGLFLYIAFFGPSYLTVPWLYAAEINPLRIRAKGAALANIVNWSINFLVVMVTPIMVANIGWGTYCFFAAVNFCFLPFIWFFYPETAHRSLEEIDLIFAKGYCENISYVQAAKELPPLTADDMEELARQYGLTGDLKPKVIDVESLDGDEKMKHPQMEESV